MCGVWAAWRPSQRHWVCWSSSIAGRMGAVLHGADELERRRLRPSTQLVYSRGVADFVAFCQQRGVTALPAPLEALRAYMYYCTTDRNLDAQTVEGRMSALGDWHRR